MFPKNFQFPSVNAVGKSAKWSGYANFDGNNNILSINGTGVKNFPKITSLYTAVVDLGKNIISEFKSFTGSCSKQNNPYPLPANFINVLNEALVHYSKLVKKEPRDGKTYRTFQVAYKDVINGELVYADKDLVNLKGTVMGEEVEVKVNSPYKTLSFNRDEHIPEQWRV